MAARVVVYVCYSAVRVRTLHACRGFHVTSKRHYARSVKQRTKVPQSFAADVPLQPPHPPSNHLHDVVDSLNDDNQFE